MRTSTQPSPGSDPQPGDRRAISLPAISHPGRLIGFLVVTLIVAGLAFAAGWFVRSPTSDALSAAQERLVVTAPVSLRIVAPVVSLSAILKKGDVADVGPASGTVTQQDLHPGDVVSPGMSLGEVSGRPLIAIPEGIPLYRDLAEGDKGNDVLLLQRWLVELGYAGLDPVGEVGPVTLSAVEWLYERVGYSAPGDGTRIVWRELMALPATAPVAESAPISRVLGVDTPLLRLTVQPNVLTSRATVVEADQLHVGQPMRLTAPDITPVETTVLSIGPFTAASDSAIAGNDVTFAIPSDTPLREGSPLTVTSLSTAEPGPAVPLTALRQDSTGVYVVLFAPDPPGAVTPGGDDDIPEEVRVYVRVSASAEGWAAIEPDEQLPTGTQVIVSG